MNDKKEVTFHMYDRRLDRLLKRIKGETITDYKEKVGKTKQPSNLTSITPKNRELLLRVHSDCIRKGNSLARQLARLERLSQNFLLFGNKDIETATPADFQEVADKIMNNPHFTASTKRIRVEELKRLDKEYFGEGEEYTPRTKKLKFAKTSKSTILPEEVITEKEAIKIINSARSVRDKAFLSTLWATGARVGELGNAKVKHFQPSDQANEAYMHLDGKTGRRRVLLVEAVQDIKDWLSAHPLRNSPNFEDAYLFCKMEKGHEGEVLQHSGIQKIVKVAMVKAGVKKKKNPHLWRHSKATYLCAKGLGEMQMKQFFGWAKGSDMPAIYSHLSGKQTDDALRQALGLEHSKEIELRCRICGTNNQATESVCIRCNNPLTVEGFIKIKQQNEYLQEATEVMQQLHAKAFELARQGVPLNIAEDQAKVLVAEAFAEKLKSQKASINGGI